MIIRPQIIFVWSDDGLCPKLNRYKKIHLDCVLFTISRKRPTNYCDIKLLEDSINPRTAGGLSHLHTAGGGADDRPPPPENSKTKKDSDKR